MKYLTSKQLLLAALCIGMTACTDSLTEHNPLPDTPHGATMFVTLPFGIATPTAAGDVNTTRSIPTTVEDKTGDSSDNYVKNVWVLQFEGTGTTAILKNTCFVDGDNIHFSTSGKDTLRNVTLLTGSDIGKAQRLLLVANVPQGRAYTWSAVGTSLLSILEVTQAIASEADTHATLDGKETLLMSDIIDSSSGTIGFLSKSVNLERSIAKLTVKLSVAENCIIDSVKIGGVPTVLPLAAAALLDEMSLTSYPPTPSTVINYPSETTDAASSGDGSEDHPYTWTWYLPCNLKGTTTTTSQLDKTKDAPPGATYIKIYATNSDSGDRSIFTLYPGADLIKDYNLKSNHHYTYHFTLDGCGVEGDEEDSREQVIPKNVIDYTDKDEDANCYMLHPNAVGGTDRYYRIPIGRINDYWTGTADGYGKLSSAPLTAGTTWYASVLWSDMTEITTATPIAVSGAYTGRRWQDYFTVKIPAATSASKPAGNFVVAVKDASGTILWSWHMWVTDYDPDEYVRVADGTLGQGTLGTYLLTNGGEVESYCGTAWNSGGVLHGKAMMDRPLGTIIFGSMPSTTSRGQFYYQFGRKDPFPISLDGLNTLQFANGGTFPTAELGYKTIATSVQAPTTFYDYGSNGYDWTNDIQGTDCLWNDPNASDNHQKSIYDPCPPGWQVPVNGVWDDFTNETFLWSASPAPGRVYRYSFFFAATGYRSGGGLGILTDFSERGYCWTSSPSSNGSWQLFFITYLEVDPIRSANRSCGFPVRCIQE
jgi:hypothetical protein